MGPSSRAVVGPLEPTVRRLACWWFGCQPDYEAIRHDCEAVPCERCGAPDTTYADRCGDTRHNRTVERAYDGSHLTFPGASPAIQLRKSQKDAIWRVMASRTNTLLSHVVGAGKTYTNGVFDSSTDPTFTSVTGATCEAVIIFVKTAGANTTWPVVAYLDTNITNLPVTPNGGNITVTWNASGIFGL